MIFENNRIGLLIIVCVLLALSTAAIAQNNCGQNCAATEPPQESEPPAEPLPDETATDNQQSCGESTEPTPPEEPIPEETPGDTIPEEPVEQPSLLKTILNIILGKISVIKGEILNITAQLLNENKTPVQDQPVDFYVDGTNLGQEITDDEGLAQVSWDTTNVEPGAYIIDVDFPGNSILESSHDDKEIIVEEQPKDKPAEETPQATSWPEGQAIIATPQESKAQSQELSTVQEEKEVVVSHSVKRTDDCTTETWYEEEPVYGTCTEPSSVRVCDGPLNQTCWNETSQREYRCQTGTQTVEKTQETCAPKSYLVNEAVKLGTEDYRCSTTEENGQVIVICDSKYDGNGDGKCSSGESCMKFVIEGSQVQQFEKNSRDDFISRDESFFLSRVPVEVTK